ncbi:hypothetical protein EW146_g6815 [Bondarzewia mesenterica]|uniref:Integrase catalytic domain-containing protein n=1 Tax=Bondarzewia mesenterica TaxID=1095465 RepID=A0A4S4LPF2_9AGAM|nr:hypothetical protein EW146_g6815 [Bondarzewia mesenterica]
MHRDQKIGTLCSDRGGEYEDEDFNCHLKANGTRHELTVHDSPQQNGRAECLNGTLVTCAIAMLLQAGLPKFLWAEAINHCVWVWNRTGTRALAGKTPVEAATGRRPDLRDLHEWGCRVWVKVEGRGKLDAKADEGHFVGYDAQSKGYRIYWPSKRHVSVEHNVVFMEEKGRTGEDTVLVEGEPVDFGTPNVSLTPPMHDASSRSSSTPAPFTSAPSSLRDDTAADSEGEHAATPHVPSSSSDIHPTVIPSSISVADDDLFVEDDAPKLAGRQHRETRPSEYVHHLQRGEGVASGLPISLFPGVSPTGGFAGMVEVVDDEDEGTTFWDDVRAQDVEHALATRVTDSHEPRNVTEARRGSDWSHWEAAMKTELGMIEKLGTWELVDRPSDANVVGSKWVFKIKRGADGEIIKYKARLVAQGFTQVPGIDYSDTFAPVAKLESIRALLAIAARNDWEIHQMDVKNAYLNGDLEETIFMEQPPGFTTPGAAEKVCHLFKTIYGLKQSSRRWYKKLCDAFLKLGFTRCSVDHGVFWKCVGKDILVIAASVDDLAIFSSALRLLESLKDELNKAFEMTDLGEISWLLGIEIRRDQKARTVALSQRAFIDTIVSRFNLENAKPLSTPLDPSFPLNKTQCPSTPRQYEEMRGVPFQEAIGSVMYAARRTRPDIAFSVTYLSQFMQNPGKAHWEGVKRVLRYLKGTREKWLVFGEKDSGLEGFSDADWASQEHRHSISGYVFLLDGGAVSWSAKKQPIVALSSTEAEYIAMMHAAKEAFWLDTLFRDIFGSPLTSPIPLNCDNQSAIALARDNAFHARTKHIDICYHFIREAVNAERITLPYCPTDDMAADIFYEMSRSPEG